MHEKGKKILPFSSEIGRNLAQELNSILPNSRNIKMGM
jgi:hypothetical protein